MQRCVGEMINLLRQHDEAEWASDLDFIKQRLYARPVTAANSLLMLFGGPGTLNDLLLFKDGKPLYSENDRLAKLKDTIYLLAKEIASS